MFELNSFFISVILPRLAAMAMANNQVADEIKKREVALELFEAYSSMSCCCIFFYVLLLFAKHVNSTWTYQVLVLPSFGVFDLRR